MKIEYISPDPSQGENYKTRLLCRWSYLQHTPAQPQPKEKSPAGTHERTHKSHRAGIPKRVTGEVELLQDRVPA